MIELHGTKVSVSSDGVQTVSRTYYVESEGEIDDIPRSGSGINGRAVELVGIESTQAEEGRQFIVTGKYEGMASKDLARTTYEWTSEQSEDAIETNVNFDIILKKYGGYKKDPNSDEYIWPDIKPKRAKSPSKSPMQGVKSFLSLGGVWMEVEVVERIPADVFKGMWSLVESVPGDLPTPANRLWLALPPDVSQRGTCFVIKRRWKLTGEMDEAKLELAKMIYHSLTG